MNNDKHDLIISGLHLELTDALKNIVTEKMEKLFRHEHQIIRIRVELEYRANGRIKDNFVAKGHIEINGPDLVASVSSDDLYKSIDLLSLKLDRMLRRRARVRKAKRHRLHGVDIPADIPKSRVA